MTAEEAGASNVRGRLPTVATGQTGSVAVPITSLDPVVREIAPHLYIHIRLEPESLNGKPFGRAIKLVFGAEPATAKDVPGGFSEHLSHGPVESDFFAHTVGDYPDRRCFWVEHPPILVTARLLDYSTDWEGLNTWFTRGRLLVRWRRVKTIPPLGARTCPN
jgi:hypothetical protein